MNTMPISEAIAGLSYTAHIYPFCIQDKRELTAEIEGDQLVWGNTKKENGKEQIRIN